MSIRLQMLQAARVAPRILGASADLIRRFLQGEQCADGGFRGRGQASDLYYTVFGLNGLISLQSPPPPRPLTDYLQGFGDGESLDFVHLCCLARAWASFSGPSPGQTTQAAAKRAADILGRLEKYRSGNGGYSGQVGAEHGTAYGAFLGLSAYQDLQAQLPDPTRLVESLRCLQRSSGGWANEIQVQQGSTNATAAALAVLGHLGAPVPASAGDWLLARHHPQGGFVAAPAGPMPDLLSTASALHALSGLGRDLAPLREQCLDFVDSLWTNAGGFYGYWLDDQLDCEYTFYGLLALGHLAV